MKKFCLCSHGRKDSVCQTDNESAAVHDKFEFNITKEYKYNTFI